MLGAIHRASIVIAMLIFSAQTIIGQSDKAISQTIDIADGPLVGHAIGSMVVMNAPCFYGSPYHYEINSQGELRVQGPILCGNLKAGGGQLVCYLDPQLRCQSRTDFSGGAGVPFAIDEQGVKTNNKTYPWTNVREALGLMPAIQRRAKEKCNTVLSWQAVDKKRSPPSTPSADERQERESCAPMLEQMCASAHGSAAKLSDGKDVSALCPR